MLSHKLDNEQGARLPSQIYENITTSGHALAHFGNNFDSTVLYHNEASGDGALSEKKIRKSKRTAILAHLMHADMELRSEGIKNLRIPAILGYITKATAPGDIDFRVTKESSG